MLLYHGTSEANLMQILQCGIMPRSVTQKDNWAHTVKSHEDAVYLSIAYPLYFASQATDGKERLAVIEIDTDRLDERKLVADEDAIEQVFRGRDKLSPEWSMEERTEYYRERIHMFRHGDSLKALGSCAHLGAIDKGAILRVAFVTFAAYVNMVRAGYDPTVSVGAFQACGSGYKKSTQWLFDPENVKQEYIEFGAGMRHGMLPIMDDRTGIHIEQVAN